MKDKSRVLNYFIKNDCKVGTTFENKSKTKLRKIVGRISKGSYRNNRDDNTETSSVDIFVEDESGNIYYDNVHYERKTKSEMERFENIMDQLSLKEMTNAHFSLKRASKLTPLLTENKIYIY